MDAMNTEDFERGSLKQKAIHEGKECALILSLFSFFLLRTCNVQPALVERVSRFAYSVALIKALAIAKVILRTPWQEARRETIVSFGR